MSSNDKGYRRCPYCDSVLVCWNWVNAWGGDLDRYCKENPHLTREELSQTMWVHECWNCEDCNQTAEKVEDGIPYSELTKKQK